MLKSQRFKFKLNQRTIIVCLHGSPLVCLHQVQYLNVIDDNNLLSVQLHGSAIFILAFSEVPLHFTLHPAHLQSSPHLHPAPHLHPVAGQESEHAQVPAEKKMLKSQRLSRGMSIQLIHIHNQRTITSFVYTVHVSLFTSRAFLY